MTAMLPASKPFEPGPSPELHGPPRRPQGRLVAAATGGLAMVFLVGWWWYALRPENCYQRGCRALTAGDRQTVIRESRRLIGTPGFEPQGRLLSGRLLLSERRPADALAELQRAVHDPATAVEALIAAAECHYLLGQYLQAIGAGRAALERNTAALDARRWLAAAYYDLGATPYATLELEAISAAAPSDPRPDRLLGLMCKDNQ